MTIAQSIQAVPLVQRAVDVASAVTSLPAVATQDWCARAAAALRIVKPNSIASVSLVSLGTRGAILQFEATGAIGASIFGRSIEAGAVHPDHTSGFDWWFDEEVERFTEAQVAPLRSLACAAHWLESGAGRRWARLGVSDLIVARSPMQGGSVNRAIVVEIGTPTTTAGVSDECEILRAVMPLLVRRASLAFGYERSTALTRLTQREQQVLEHLALGKSVKQIAVDLERSPHTVHDHVKSLHRKLNASTRGELIARALGHLAGSPRRHAAPTLRPDFSESGAGALEPKTLMSA